MGEGGESCEGENGTRVLFKVLDSVVPALDPDDPATAQLQAQYRNMFADDVLTAFLSRLEGGMTVRVNPTVLNSAMGGAS